jgi:outer membrane murein-binding lipoprotein Lpp
MKSARQFYAGYLGIPISAFDGFIWSSSVTHHFSTDQVWNTLQAALSDGYLSGCAQVANRDARISQLESELQQKNQRISTLESGSEQSNLKQVNKCLMQSNSGLYGQINDRDSQISTLHNQISSLNRQVSSLNSQIGNLGNQIPILNNRLVAEKNDAISILKNQHQLEVQKLQKQLESDKQNHDFKVVSLEKELLTTRQSIQKCNDQILVLEKMINEKLEKNIKQQESQIQALISKIEKLKRHLNKTQKNPEANQIKPTNADTVQRSPVDSSNKCIANNNIFNRILSGSTKTDVFQNKNSSDKVVSQIRQSS